MMIGLPIDLCINPLLSIEMMSILGIVDTGIIVAMNVIGMRMRIGEMTDVMIGGKAPDL